MKVLGMLFIIWGHCFPETMSAFIYAFNVPVFFVISGFLNKEEKSSTLFPKLWRTLVLPYLLLAYIKGAGSIIKGFSTGEWWQTAGGILLGFHTVGDIQGCSNLWFLYTLILLRLLSFVVKANKWCMIGLSIVSVVAAIMLDGVVDMPAWAVSDVLIALPFFTIGYVIKLECKSFVDMFVSEIQRQRVLYALCAVALFVVTWIIGYYNGAARMFCGGYGESMLLFLIGAIVGTISLFIICVLLDNVKWKYLGILVAGNLVTLTFHRELLHEPLKWISKSNVNVLGFEETSTFLLSVVVLLLFVPINWLVSRYVPILIGKRK